MRHAYAFMFAEDHNANADIRGFQEFSLSIFRMRPVAVFRRPLECRVKDRIGVYCSLDLVPCQRRALGARGRARARIRPS